MAPGDEQVPITTEREVDLCLQVVRTWAAREGLGLVDQTKLMTAASELVRNAVRYGGGGTMTVGRTSLNGISGVRVVVRDHGPGMADIDLALTDGYTTGGSMGLGLAAARRLADEFSIESTAGGGTTVTISRRRRPERPG
jgi:serine/threonine-protein kinase RsbT